MTKTPPPKARLTLDQAFSWIVIVCSAVAIGCSFILAQDELALAKNPHFIPSCNLNPVLSCGNVIRTQQAAVFGFPNPWLGLAAFASFLTVGVVLLAGAQLKRWFWLAYEAGLALAIIFAYWLLVQSVYIIGALCPFCLVVDVVLTTLFWYSTLQLIAQRQLLVPKRLARVAAFARQHHAEILVTWFIVLIALILQHFWYYYGQFL